MHGKRWVVDGVADLERELPGFEPYRLGRVEDVHLRFKNDDDGTGQRLDVLIRIQYWTPEPVEYLVELAFENVRQMRMPELGSSVFDLSELEVTDVSVRGLEGIRREVRDYSTDGFFVACASVRAVAVLTRSGDSTTPVWRAPDRMEVE